MCVSCPRVTAEGGSNMLVTQRLPVVDVRHLGTFAHLKCSMDIQDTIYYIYTHICIRTFTCCGEAMPTACDCHVLPGV